MTVPEELLTFLKHRNPLLLLTHLEPDADGLGSSLALAMALDQLGKRTTLLVKDPITKAYRFLPGQERFLSLETFTERGFCIGDFPSVVILDCNHLDRVVDSANRQFFAGSEATYAIVDHHETERSFGAIRWIEPDSAATGLMVYEIIGRLGVSLSRDMAVNLYAAISLDTGNFRFSNTTPEVLSAAANLTRAGAEPQAITQQLYELWSVGRFALFAKVMNALELNDGIALTTVTMKMFEETGTTSDDTETFVSFPRVMKDVRVSVLLRELDEGLYKVSLRSRGEVNVARVAESFGGGGHRNAAGCRIRADLPAVKATLFAKIRELDHCQELFVKPLGGEDCATGSSKE